MLFLIFIFIFLFVVFYYCISNHLHLDLKSLFKRGFSKQDDKFGLYTFHGEQGSGKTYSAVRMCMNLKIQNDLTIITNVKSFNCFSDTIYEPDILKIIDLVIKATDVIGKRCKYIIFFDEIFTVLMRSYKNQALQKPIISFLAQLRKRGVIFITTAQIWNEIPIEFRRLCRFTVRCSMINFIRAFTINRVGDGYNCRWNDELQDFEAPILQTNVAKANLFVVQSYDTYETISAYESNKGLARKS